MEPGTLAILLLLPFVAVFECAAWKEHRRVRQKGRSTYGLTYDPESNTTYIGTIADTAASYDPEDYDRKRPAPRTPMTRTTGPRTR